MRSFSSISVLLAPKLHDQRPVLKETDVGQNAQAFLTDFLAGVLGVLHCPNEVPDPNLGNEPLDVYDGDSFSDRNLHRGEIELVGAQGERVLAAVEVISVVFRIERGTVEDQDMSAQA